MSFQVQKYIGISNIANYVFFLVVVPTLIHGEKNTSKTIGCVAIEKAP